MVSKIKLQIMMEFEFEKKCNCHCSYDKTRGSYEIISKFFIVSFVRSLYCLFSVHTA